MTNADFNGDSEFFRMISNEQGCGYFATDGQSITVNQPKCVDAMTKIKEMKDAGIISSADWGNKITNNTAGKVATQMYGGWYEGTVRTESPDGKGKWGVYLMPSLTADGPHAANLGGSSLAITAASKNKEAAYAYLNYTLGTNEGQVTMLKEFGLVPSLISALDDPYVSAAAALLGRPGGVEGHPRHAAEDRPEPRHAVPERCRNRSCARRRSNISAAAIPMPRQRSTTRPTRSPRRPGCRSRSRAPARPVGRGGQRLREAPMVQPARRIIRSSACRAICCKEELRMRQRNRTAYAFLAPYLLIFVAFWVWPIISSFLISFQKTRTVPWRFAPGVQLGAADQRSRPSSMR